MIIDTLSDEDKYKLLYPLFMTLVGVNPSKTHYKHYNQLTQEDVELLISIIRETSDISLNTVNNKKPRVSIKLL